MDSKLTQYPLGLAQLSIEHLLETNSQSSRVHLARRRIWQSGPVPDVVWTSCKQVLKTKIDVWATKLLKTHSRPCPSGSYADPMLHLAIESERGGTCRMDYIITFPSAQLHPIEETRTIPSWEPVGHDFVMRKELKEEPWTSQPLQFDCGKCIFTLSQHLRCSLRWSYDVLCPWALGAAGQGTSCHNRSNTMPLKVWRWKSPGRLPGINEQSLALSCSTILYWVHLFRVNIIFGEMRHWCFALWR